MADRVDSELQAILDDIAAEAIERGATASAVISSKHIQVKEELAALCNGEYRCPNYGFAAGCPPHVGGPAAFRQWQAQSDFSISLKIEVPTSVMFSCERNSVMQLLHHVVAAVEQKAIEAGFTNSKGFAGGSCKELFCKDKIRCCVLAENKPCPHQEIARPSLSGFGIDAVELMKTSGWSAPIADTSTLPEKDETSWVAGFILLVPA